MQDNVLRPEKNAVSKISVSAYLIIGAQQTFVE